MFWLLVCVCVRVLLLVRDNINNKNIEPKRQECNVYKKSIVNAKEASVMGNTCLVAVVSTITNVLYCAQNIWHIQEMHKEVTQTTYKVTGDL